MVKQALIVMLLATSAATAAPKAKLMSVQVREGQLRGKPSFLGNIVATVQYGDRLAVEEEQGAWTHVSVPDSETDGWIHTSALTKKRVKLKAGEEDAELKASSGELALAGKGFNSDVEAEFKTQNKDIDFTWVDKMETFRVSVKQAQAFLKAGKVEVQGGAK